MDLPTSRLPAYNVGRCSNIAVNTVISRFSLARFTSPDAFSFLSISYYLPCMGLFPVVQCRFLVRILCRLFQSALESQSCRCIRALDFRDRAIVKGIMEDHSPPNFESSSRLWDPL